MALPTLLFVHGMWSHPRVWSPMRAHFEAAGHTTLAPALPGHDRDPGASPPDGLGRLGLADYVAALEPVAREAGENLVIIGHSMGGLLAQLLASRAPHRGLVLLSPAPSAAILTLAVEPLRTLWPLLTRWGFWREAVLPARASALYGIFNGVEADEAEAETAALIHDSGRALFQIALPWADATGGAHVETSRLTRPALVVTGTQDRIVPMSVARATARRLAGPVTYREMDGFGHWTIGRKGSPIITAHVQAFLAGLPA